MSDAVQPPNSLDVTADFQRADSQATRVVEVLDQYLAALKAGEPPKRAELLAKHPDIAGQLEACLAGMEFIHASSAGSQPAGKRLGDFRILREVGHGGMGAVYEAEQISLGRRVALKILRFGPVSDPDALERFQREAETVARLHHTNIVPIFAVGSEGGVNYYAMQFIVGRSLDQVLRAKGQPLDARTVAEWGMQAAEALAHAHARGVIHRDVKPSNLLIDDEEGRIWLTDFGLAKRLDDVTLSMTGALLGTPRYMSPEQAQAAHHKLDHRTDLYSLGATLYELATGKPVVTGDSPHDVIMQILASEPIPPRQHVPSLPRDLDTILLKCLAKESRQRYATARQLADDLRAFLDNRPISARRTSFVELAGRWLQRQKQSVALGAIAVVTTLILVMVGIVGGYAWHRARLSSLMLKTDHPPVLAELLPRGSSEVVASTSIPTLEPLETPAGDYQLRLSALNRLSQSYDVHLARGDRIHRKLDLEDQLLWKDLKVDRSFKLARFEFRPTATSAEEVAIPTARSDVIELHGEGLRCLSGATSEPRWALALRNPDQPLLKEQTTLVWPWNAKGGVTIPGVDRFDVRPFFVSASENAPGTWDLDADGVSDLVLAAQHQAWVLSLSGATGTPLWMATREEGTQGGINGAVCHPPLVVADQDGDGLAELAATFIVAAPGKSAKRWIELLSGSSGKTLWRHDLPDAYFTLPDGEDPPYEMRWFHGSGGGYSSGGSMTSQQAHYYVRSHRHVERSGPAAYLPSAPVLRSTPGAAAQLTFVAGTHWVVLDVASGVPVSAVDTGVRTGIEPRYGDFDGDGQSDLLLTESSPATPPRLTPGPRLVAWSPARQAKLWSRTLDADFPRQSDAQSPRPAWPLVADLDNDGASDVLTPVASSLGQQPWTTPPWGELALLDGRTGEPRWRRRVMNSDQQLDYFLAGPDINGDGQREVYVVAVWSNWELFVDCLSGSDGQPLWRSRAPLFNPATESNVFWLSDLFWRHDGGDGWPQLVVSARRQSGDAPDRMFSFSAGSGALMHTAPGMAVIEQADLNGDGATDLLLGARDVNSWDRAGNLQAVSGVARENWRSVLVAQQVVGDLNGDGVRDLVSANPSQHFEARCGSTGQLLWESAFQQQVPYQMFSHPAAQRDARQGLLPVVHDLNRDGTPDILLTGGLQFPTGQESPIVVALSGKTGRTLWKGELLAKLAISGPWLDCRDLDGDGNVEIILAAAVTNSGARTPARLDLSVLNGADGKIRWSEPLIAELAEGTQAFYDLDHLWLEAAYADLNGDGQLDILLPAQENSDGPQLALRAFSGRNGQPLWSAPLPSDPDVRRSLGEVAPAAVADTDGDGKLEVAVVALADESTPQGPATFIRLELLDGATGVSRWQWKARAKRWANLVHIRADRMPDRLRPILVRRPGGKQWFALRSVGQNQQLHVIDETGHLVSQLQLASNHPDSPRLWALDANGDGSDEVVVLDEQGIAVRLPAQLDQPLWRRPQPMPRINALLGLLPVAGTAGQIVALGEGGSTFLGIDAATGRDAWNCVTPKMNLTVTPQMSLLAAPGLQTPGQVCFQMGEVALVRQSRMVGQPPPLPTPIAGAFPKLPYDPRLLRPLPWALKAVSDLVQGVRFFLWSLFYGITLIAVPAIYFGWLIYHRRWSLQTFLLLPAVAGLFLMGVLINGPENDFRKLAGKLSVGIVFALPCLFAGTVALRWIWQHKWRTLLGWFLAGLILGGLILLGLALGLSLDREPLLPGERWSWEGWYWVFIPVYFALAVFLSFLVPVWWLVVWLGGRWEGRPLA